MPGMVRSRTSSGNCRSTPCGHASLISKLALRKSCIRRIENYLRASKGFVDGYPFEGAHFNYRDRERWRRLRIPGEERRACLELLYAGSRAIAALIGRQRRPIIRSIRTLRIRQGHGLDGSTAVSTSPLRAASI